MEGNKIMGANQKLIIIAFIHNGDVRARFANSLWGFKGFDLRRRDLCGTLLAFGGPNIPDNRNRSVGAFLTLGGAEWLLFVDSDIAFEPEAVYALLDSADPIERPIVSALIFNWHNGRSMPIWINRGPDGDYRRVEQFSLGMQPIDACGAGFLLIHRSVLEKMRERYEGKDAWMWFANDQVQTTEGPKRLGEDYTFCQRARDLGFAIFGNGDVRVDHLKIRPQNLQTFLQENPQPAKC
jgi:GT2 family glycosyltransferase